MFLRSWGPRSSKSKSTSSATSIVDGLRHIDAARFGQRLDPRRDVDAVAKDVAFLDDDVAEIDSDPHRDALFIRQRLVRLRDRIAQRGGAARGLDDVVEIDEHQFGGLLEDISAEFGDLRFDDLGQKGSQLGEVLLLVAGEQPAVAGHQDGRRSAPDAPSRCLHHNSRAPLSRRCQAKLAAVPRV